MKLSKCGRSRPSGYNPSGTINLGEYVGQICGLAILHRIDKDPPTRPLCRNIDAFQPPLNISPSRLAVAYNQKPIDSWNGYKSRGKSLFLYCRRSIGLHDLCHLFCQFLGSSDLRLVDFHAHAGKDVDIDQFFNLQKAPDIRG